ncbi:MAG: DUF4249 domain-containing protein [Bacteroidales bacterium]|nr:DUF4249 domain-containing protein [Bacteroidales bacterium]
MKKNIIIAFIIVAIFSSCEKTITIEIPDNGRKLVVNSLFTGDSVLSLSLLESKYILDESFSDYYRYEYDSVSGAKIDLYENEQFIEQLNEISKGKYQSNYIIKTDKDYQIKVLAENFPDLSAESYVPEKPEILGLEVYDTRDEEGYEVTGFTLRFKDNPEQSNYYFIEAFEKVVMKDQSWETGNDTIISYTNSLNVYSSDPNAYSDDWGLGEGILLNDELLNGEDYLFKFFAYSSSYYYYDEYGNSYPDENIISVTYVVYLNSISKDYYQYYKSLSKHLEAQYEFFMEPVQVYTNVENGFGIFAGYSSDVDSVRIDLTQ